MSKKISPILILFLIFGFIYNATILFGLDKPADKIKIELISPIKPHTKLPKTRVDTTPVVVSGAVPLEIDKTANVKDIEKQRYLVEYFIDGKLAYKTDGLDIGGYGRLVLGYGSPNFSWLLDTTKYRNGKHKLVVNFWDTKGPSAIGIVYIIIENPLSIEQIKEETAGE